MLPSGTLFTLLIVVIEQGCLVLTVSTPHCRNPAFPLVEVKQSSFVLCKRVLISPFCISQIVGNVFILPKLETLSLAPKPSILKAPFRKTTMAGQGLPLARLGPPWGPCSQSGRPQLQVTRGPSSWTGSPFSKILFLLQPQLLARALFCTHKVLESS